MDPASVKELSARIGNGMIVSVSLDRPTSQGSGSKSRTNSKGGNRRIGWNGWAKKLNEQQKNE